MSCKEWEGILTKVGSYKAEINNQGQHPCDNLANALHDIKQHTSRLFKQFFGIIYT